MSDQATERAAALWAEGQRWDEVLGALRAEGCSKNDSIRATVEVLRLSLSAAKRLVHGSGAWLDTREADERWHEELVGELRPQVVPPQR